MEETYLYSLTGKRFPRKPAVLKGYERVIPNAGYPYIVSKIGGQVDGFILFNVDPEALKTIDAYEDEGSLYLRQAVVTQVDGEPVACHTYVGNVDALKRQFGQEVEVDRRVKMFLESKVRQLLENLGGEEALPYAPSLVARARSELLGEQIRDLVETHFRFPPLFKLEAEKRLRRINLPTLEKIKESVEMQRYANRYLKLAVRHIVFNQIEEKVRHDFYGAVRVPNPFYEHTVSALVALMFLNRMTATVEELIHEGGADCLHGDWEYLDYVLQGILIADRLYHPEAVRPDVEWIRTHRQLSVTPMGAEVEFSNLGAAAVFDSGGNDPAYDGFYYFPDFFMLRRCWKLGGHIDDHRIHEDPRERRRGFLEYAFGRISILGHLSKPVTNDPWILNQLINQAVHFVDVAPHSLHIAIEPQRPIRTTGRNELADLIALLLLGGDFQPRGEGGVMEVRVGRKEICDPEGKLYFFEENRHVGEIPPNEYEDTVTLPYTPVIEYKFPRLFRNHNYEPLIIALKGYTLARDPRPFYSDFRVMTEPSVMEEAGAIVDWAWNPQPLSPADIGRFINAVEDGLMTEKEERSGHSPRYIRDNLDAIEECLQSRSSWLRQVNQRRKL